MSDLKLFRITGSGAKSLEGRESELEKPLQVLVEDNLEALLAIRFLTSEHSTGSKHSGRIDTLGIDENGCPVVLEYKRSLNENVITQGLYYLDWLMDHRAEFELLVHKKFGSKAAEEIDWNEPRLICLASDFTKFDAYAVQQIDRSIDLIRYRQFDGDLLLLEKVNAMESTPKPGMPKPKTVTKSRVDSGKPSPRWINDIGTEHRRVLEEIERYMRSLGDDVERKNLMLYLHLDPAKVSLEAGFSRDVKNVGHWGTGDLALYLNSLVDFEKAKPLIQQAYQNR